MFSLAEKLESSVEIDGKEYELDLSFDNILLVFKVINDKEIDDLSRLFVCLDLLFIRNDGEELPFQDNLMKQVEIYKNIMEKVIARGKKQKQKQKLDLAGEPIEGEPKTQYYSLEQDAEYIFASFLYYYNINLFHEQGKMHWYEFNALLVSLSDDSMFKRVVHIRQQKVTKDMTAEQKEILKEQQAMFALEHSQNDVDFESMDLAEKREYALKQLEKEGGVMNG
ncbi:Gp15 family bacteriophage protein [Listeria valentina]|uniref:Gp15 family bacteriophage protein n=1 Tax=Listeria valentina TaxID=2705293 RepID=UPI0014319D8F|nr:Gp15 family bacteriophage protein [Listeria valentina]